MKLLTLPFPRLACKPSQTSQAGPGLGVELTRLGHLGNESGGGLGHARNGGQHFGSPGQRVARHDQPVDLRVQGLDLPFDLLQQQLELALDERMDQAVHLR